MSWCASRRAWLLDVAMIFMRANDANDGGPRDAMSGASPSTTAVVADARLADERA